MPKKTGDGVKEAASTVEAKPTAGVVVEGSVATESVRDIERVLDEVFLTPRVVDQRAFDELAAGLKALVREAAEQSRALAEASRDMRRMDESLRAATKELHGKLESAVGVLPSLDRRVERAEGVLEEAKGALRDRVGEMKAIAGEDFKIDRDRIVEKVKEEVAGAIAAIVEQELRGAKGAIEGATGECIERVRHAMGELDTVSREGETRIVEMANERVEEARGRMAEAAGGAIETARAAGDDARSRIEALVESGRARLSAELEAAMEGLRGAAATAEEIGTRARQEAASATVAASGKVTPLIERADESLLRHKAVAETLDELAGSVREELRGAGATLESLLGRARGSLDEAVESGLSRIRAEQASAMETLKEAAAAEEVGGGAREGIAAESGAGTLRALIERAETALSRQGAAGVQLDELARATRERLEALHAKVEARAAEVREPGSAYAALTPQAMQQAQQVGAWLAHLVGQADLMGRGLDRLMREGGKR